MISVPAQQSRRHRDSGRRWRARTAGSYRYDASIVCRTCSGGYRFDTDRGGVTCGSYEAAVAGLGPQEKSDNRRDRHIAVLARRVDSFPWRRSHRYSAHSGQDRRRPHGCRRIPRRGRSRARHPRRRLLAGIFACRTSTRNDDFCVLRIRGPRERQCWGSRLKQGTHPCELVSEERFPGYFLPSESGRARVDQSRRRADRLWEVSRSHWIRDLLDRWRIRGD